MLGPCTSNLHNAPDLYLAPTGSNECRVSSGYVERVLDRLDCLDEK